VQTFPNAIALTPSLQSPGSPLVAGPTTVVTVAVPDEHIGAVVGKGGKYISEMQQVAGVRIKISDRTDYVPGTRNRKVTLTGTLEAVQIAQFLISQKVQQSAVEMQSNPQR
jgi:RNA-binding protein Nova